MPITTDEIPFVKSIGTLVEGSGGIKEIQELSAAHGSLALSREERLRTLERLIQNGQVYAFLQVMYVE